MRENKAIYELLYPEGEEDSLDYNDWIDETSTSIISKFKSAFGQVPSSKYTSADKGNPKAGHLEFSHVYIFVYSCFDVQNVGNMTLELSCNYGGSEKGRYQVRKYDKMTCIDKPFRVKYISTNNEITFIVRDSGTEFGSFTLDLNDFKPDKVYKMWMDIINVRDNDNDLEFEIGVLCDRSNVEPKVDTVYTHSLQRKLPERIDILNERGLNEFTKRMKTELARQLSFEKQILSEYYSEDEIKIILNHKYNFVLTKENLDMGRIDLEDLKEFNSHVLFSRWEHAMDVIYDEFTTTTKHTLENRSASVNNLIDKAAVMLLCKTLGRRNNQLYGMSNQEGDFAFSIRNFMVSLILLSNMTV